MREVKGVFGKGPHGGVGAIDVGWLGGVKSFEGGINGGDIPMIVWFW